MVPPQLGALAENDADAPDVPYAVVYRVHAQCADAAAIGGQESAQEFDCGAFASPVWPGIRDHLAPTDGQVDAAQRLDDSHFGMQQVAEDVAEAGRAHPLAVH